MGIKNSLKLGLASLVLAASSACGPSGNNSISTPANNISEKPNADKILEDFQNINKNPLRTVYIADPDYLPQAGKGYDPMLPTSSPIAPYDNILRNNGIPVPVFKEVPRISSKFESVDREDTLEEYVGMSIGASARYGCISGSGSFCRSKAINFSRRTFCMAFVYNANYGYDEYQLTSDSDEPILSEKAKKYFDEGKTKEFRETYGTEIIDRVNKSVHIVLLYRFETNSSQQLQSMRAEFETKYKNAATNARVSGDFTQWVNKTHNDSSVSIELYTAGLKTSDDSKVRSKIQKNSHDPHKVYESIADFLGREREDGKIQLGEFNPENAMPTTFTTTPYPKINHFSGVKGDSNIWLDVFKYWKQADAALKDAQVYADIQTARRQAKLSSDSIETINSYVSEAQKHYESVKNAADVYAQTGEINLVKLRLPQKLDKVYNYFYQDSKNWDMFTWLFLTNSITTKEHYNLVTPTERKTVAAILKSVGASDGNISGGDIGRLASDLERKTELNLDVLNEQDYITDLTPVLAMKELKLLSLKNQAIRNLVPLDRLANLEHLDLSNSEVLTSNNLHYVLTAPNLKRLHLKGNTNRIWNPTPADNNSRIRTLDFLKHGDANKLEELYLNQQLWLHDITNITKAVNLKTLDLTDTGIGDEQMIPLSKTDLEKLSLNSTRRLNNVSSLKHLKELADTLKELDLTRVGGNDDFGRQITSSDGFAMIGHDAAGAGSVNGRRTWVEGMMPYLTKKQPTGQVYIGLENSDLEGILPNTIVTWDSSQVHGRGDSRPHEGFPANDAPNVR